MSFRDFRENLAMGTMIGLATPFSTVGIIRNRNSNYFFTFVRFESHAAFLGIVFGVTFGVAKHAFSKTNGQSAKIGGIAAGIALCALVLFFIVDCVVRKKIDDRNFPECTNEVFTNRRTSDALEDIHCLQGVVTLGIPALLGYVQFEAIEYVRNKLK